MTGISTPPSISEPPGWRCLPAELAQDLNGSTPGPAAGGETGTPAGDRRNPRPSGRREVKSVSTHAVIDDDAGRPTPDRGGVFTYLGLAAGTGLVSDIVLPGGVRLTLATGFGWAGPAQTTSGRCRSWTSG